MASPAVIRTPAAKANTYVPCVAPLLTPPNNVTSYSDLLPVVTPFIPDEWEKLINDTTPFNKFSDVPISMRSGFDMGVHTPPSATYTPPNHNSATLFPDHVLSHIQTKLSCGHYSGPFSCSRLEHLIGPFQTSPLGTRNEESSKTFPSLETTLPFLQ